MSVTGPAGFRASGIAAGIKASGAPDLALVAAARGRVAAAATFTNNLAAAAPVRLSRAHLTATGGYARAVILNSGCANAATGAQGDRAAAETAARLADALGGAPEEILVCSTGLIGIQLPLAAVLGSITPLVGALGTDAAAGLAAAEAIRTTDTHAKQTSYAGDGFSIGGMAKGAGMIAPNMATMLAVLTTDAALEPEALQRCLRAAVELSFNSLIVDGCTSTNDTVILLASGEAGPVDEARFTAGLEDACQDLAWQLAEDAEGTTKVVHVTVTGATSEVAARQAARAVALSLLVKTSLYGADPYWGRVLSELGASGAPFELDRVRVGYGGEVVFADGGEVPHDAAAVAAHLSGKEVEIFADLGLGTGSARILTTDLGHAYIDENMRTS